MRRILGYLTAAAVVGIFSTPQPAKAGAFLWISAPTWTYSAAAADSPAGVAYFWSLTSGVGTYSFAYAFSNDGVGDAAYAFAEAATGQGGLGAVNVAGFSDPFAGVGIDLGLIDPSNPGGFPTTQPGSDPFSQSYTVDSNGITLNSESSSELNGLDGLQAFEYTGGTDLSSLEALLGASSSSGTTSAGDVSDIGTLMTDFGSSLIPLDGLNLDPSSLSTLDFTENTSGLNTSDVILVGIGNAAESPEPGTMLLAGAGLAALGLLRRRRSA